MTLSKDEICKMFGCTMDQLNAQYAANAKQLDKMRKKAVKTGKKVRGFTSDELTESTNRYNRMASKSTLNTIPQGF